MFMLWRPLLQFHADVHVDLRVHPNVLMFSPPISYLQQFCTFITRSKSNVSYLSPVLRSNISWSSSKTVSFMNPLHMYHHPADHKLAPSFSPPYVRIFVWRFPITIISPAPVRSSSSAPTSPPSSSLRRSENPQGPVFGCSVMSRGPRSFLFLFSLR